MTMKHVVDLRMFVLWFCIFACTRYCFACDGVVSKETPFAVRPLVKDTDNIAISYSPYRDGQGPEGMAPSKAEMAEDLHLISKHWNLLRTYGSSHCSRDMLQAIREQKLPLKVMIGAWISPETVADGDSRLPNREAIQANEREVACAIELANDFPEIVWAVSVGNETQVAWSRHKVPPELLVRYLRQVRTQTNVPVSVADDFEFWLEDASQKMAEEIDFIVTHIHPVWHAQDAENALRFVKDKYDAVRNAHADRIVVIGETGWASRKNPTGRESGAVRGKMGEPEQLLVFHELSDWAKQQKITLFMFEAFDENWKGDDHPDEVEKHWGLFRADRTPKLVMQQAIKEQ